MKEIIRVLQIEDVESDAALIVHILEKSGYVVLSNRVEDAEAMRQALSEHNWDVIVADYQLPRFNAAEALLIRNEVVPNIPFIVVSGSIGEERAVEMMRAGAQDYVLKDRLSRLVPAVQRETRGERVRRDFDREHRKVEDRLHDKDDWLDLVVSVTQLGMFDFYPQSGKLVLSESARRQLGLRTDSEVSVLAVAGGLHPGDRERIKGIVQKAFDPQAGGECTADYRVTGLNDKIERWLTTKGRVFFDLEGKAVRFVGVSIDISERKTLEEQFRQAQKLESIGVLAGGVAHDFNNILTVITGFTELAMEDLPADDPLRSSLQEVIDAAELATQLTRQLLTFSSRQAIQTQTILLNDIVLSVQKMLGRLISADINLAIHLDPSAGAIHADPTHIDQIIINLVVNARDAMPKGGDLIITTGHRMVDKASFNPLTDPVPGGYATISVADTGSGMTSEVRARIFDPFFTTKPAGKGTGLGLSTVFGIVKQSGGAIQVTSEVGHGSQFTVFLPAVAWDGTENAATSVISMPRGTETILLAEDDPSVRRFVRTTLEKSGYRVLECANGKEAIRQAQQGETPIDLLLSDIMMPEMTGPELASRFAACCPDVPVLYMSGYSDSTWPQTSAEETCLRKPFTPAVLLTRVWDVLHRMPEALAFGPN